MKHTFFQQFNAASAADMAEAYSSCPDFAAMMLLDAIILASIFVIAVILVRISILVLALSVILVLCLQDRKQYRLKTKAVMA